MTVATFQLKNHTSELPRLVNELAAFCAGQQVPEDVSATMRLAVEEVVTNVIHHGTDPDNTHTIAISFQWEQGEFTAIVADDGRPFDPLAHPVPNTELPIEERPIGGLGVYMVRQLMDGLEYRRDGNRNILTMKKR
jgi:anti-sigma regulatory factor (Ser/Thr protein kinase)